MNALLNVVQYEGKDVDNFEQDIVRSVQNWILYIEEHGVSHPNGPCKEFEIGRSIQYYVTDMICVLCFGHPFGFVAKHADCFEFLKTLEERLPVVEKFSIFTEVNHLLALVSHIPWLRRVLPSAGDSKGIGKIIGVDTAFQKQHKALAYLPYRFLGSWSRTELRKALSLGLTCLVLF